MGLVIAARCRARGVKAFHLPWEFTMLKSLSVLRVFTLIMISMRLRHPAESRRCRRRRRQNGPKLDRSGPHHRLPTAVHPSHSR